MLQSEEDRLAKQVKPNPSHQQTPSSSTLLYTATDDTRRSSNYNHSGRGHRGCNNNNRGGGRNRGRGRNNNSWSHNHAFPPWNYHQQPWQPPYYSNMMPQPMYPSSGYPLYAPPPTPYNHSANSGLLGPRPARPNNEAHMVHSTVSSQLPAGLTQVFNTMTLNEPDNSWYMDSGASNHIASGSGNLQSLFNTSTMPLVTVGNGSSALVKTIGQGTISSPSRTFAL